MQLFFPEVTSGMPFMGHIPKAAVNDYEEMVQQEKRAGVLRSEDAATAVGLNGMKSEAKPTLKGRV